MVKLYLTRHAKSSWDNMALSDFDRPLNDRGLVDAPSMGTRMKKLKICPDLMIASPAIRAITTARKMAAIMGYRQDKIKSDKRIYHADPGQLLGVIQGLRQVKSIMIFGHNPGFTEFANRLLNVAIDNIPTCGIVGCELNIQTWDEIRWGCGEMLFFDYPKRNT